MTGQLRTARTRVARSGSMVALGLHVICLAACDEISTVPEPPALYTVEVSGEVFVVRVETQEQVDAMEARRVGGQEGVINGELAAGDGGFNAPWSWHLEPSTVEVPDLAVEVCDGRPSMVEENPTYWLETVGRFCPWGAVVTGRRPLTPP